MGPRSRDRGIVKDSRRALVIVRASMGPRSRDRGIDRGVIEVPAKKSLQWGRGHVTAESNTKCDATAAKGKLQWGRGHVTAESVGGELKALVQELLQWGRGHVTAESPMFR